jgi:predicted DsbA family dithiol-disulfide isomerase
MQLDIFSDVICPWCYIGKRRFEAALDKQPLPELELRWRAFQLNPDMPPEGMPRQLYLQSKFGGPDRAQQIYDNIRAIGETVGIDFAFDKIMVTPSTIKAHRLINMATTEGCGDAVVNELFQAYFLNGVNIGETGALVEAATTAGMDAERTRERLETDEASGEVLAESRFAYQNGINGVPFFIFGKRYALSGAQEPESFFPLFDLLEQGDDAPPPAA